MLKKSGISLILHCLAQLQCISTSMVFYGQLESKEQQRWKALAVVLGSQERAMCHTEPHTESVSSSWSQESPLSLPSNGVAAAYVELPRPECIKEKGEAQKFGGCYYGKFCVCWGFLVSCFHGCFFSIQWLKGLLGFLFKQEHISLWLGTA